MFVIYWTNPGWKWLRIESIRNDCFSDVTIRLASRNESSGKREFTYLSHTPNGQNPYTIGGFSEISANGSESVAKNTTALSPRVSLAVFDG